MQYLSIRYAERLAEAGIATSVGSRGDSYDNALAETVNGHKADPVHRRGPWRGCEDLELATLKWGVAPVTAREAMAAAQQVLRRLRSHPVGLESGAFRVTASIGLSIFPNRGAAPEALLANADLAMYEAKECGNAVVLFDPKGGAAARAALRLEWKRKVDEALRSNRLTLACQPFVELDSGQIRAYELLLRVPGVDGELLSTADFVAMAEHFGLIAHLDRWVMRESLAIQAALAASGQDLNLHVNLSAHALRDPVLLRSLRQGISAQKIDPGRMTFEITETAAMADPTRVARFVTRLKSIGCRLALDDFGVGFSSFSRLKDLAADVLKIDGAFVTGMASNEVDRHLVGAMAQAARALGMDGSPSS